MEDELKSVFQDAEFLGYRSGDDLYDIISKSAFVVVPSEWYENCSILTSQTAPNE